MTRTDRPAARLPEAPTKHDAVLAAIPVLLLAALLVGVALSTPLARALAAGSVPATAAVGYALFYAPPDGEE